MRLSLIHISSPLCISIRWQAKRSAVRWPCSHAFILSDFTSSNLRFDAHAGTGFMRANTAKHSFHTSRACLFFYCCNQQQKKSILYAIDKCHALFFIHHYACIFIHFVLKTNNQRNRLPIDVLIDMIIKHRWQDKKEEKDTWNWRTSP